MATTLEEQADKIEYSKNDVRKKISDIFGKYIKSLQISTSQPEVIDSDGNTVAIRIEVFVKLTDKNLSAQIDDMVREYFRYPKRYATENEVNYLELSIVSGGNRIAWDELTKNGLMVEISFLEGKQVIPVFGNFSNWFTVTIVENKAFEIALTVNKKSLKSNLTPTIKLITRSCAKNGIRENSCES